LEREEIRSDDLLDGQSQLQMKQKDQRVTLPFAPRASKDADQFALGEGRQE
jgi:hypothetical protein